MTSCVSDLRWAICEWEWEGERCCNWRWLGGYWNIAMITDITPYTSVMTMPTKALTPEVQCSNQITNTRLLETQWPWQSINQQRNHNQTKQLHQSNQPSGCTLLGEGDGNRDRAAPRDWDVETSATTTGSQCHWTLMGICSQNKARWGVWEGKSTSGGTGIHAKARDGLLWHNLTHCQVWFTVTLISHCKFQGLGDWDDGCKGGLPQLRAGGGDLHETTRGF